MNYGLKLGQEDMSLYFAVVMMKIGRDDRNGCCWKMKVRSVLLLLQNERSLAGLNYVSCVIGHSF